MAERLYTAVAEIYSYLMQYIGYDVWAEYILDILDYAELEPRSALEIAGGTGSLADILKKNIPNLILTDRSLQMLKKNRSEDLPKVCCDMRNLPFKKEFDFIFSTFDSVNYMLTKEDLKVFFGNVYSLLSEIGLFTFDVALENNSLRHLRSLNRKGEYNGIKFRQISKFDKNKKIHLNHFIFNFPDGTVKEEIHRQKIFGLLEIFDALDETGFFVTDCFDTFSFKDVNEKSERAQFLVIKK